MNSAPTQFNHLLLRDLIEIAIAHGLTIEQFKGASAAMGQLPVGVASGKGGPAVVSHPAPEGSSPAAQASDIDIFASALMEASCSLASLPPDVLVHVMNEDDKSAFITWFEGRPNFDADDWLMLLTLLRVLMPDLFSGIGVR